VAFRVHDFRAPHFLKPQEEVQSGLYDPVYGGVKEECLAKLILLSEGSLRRALRDYEAHYHEERNHQGKDNQLLLPLRTPAVRGEHDKVECRERLGGLLKYYERKAA
jgi:putative transposase